MRIILSMAAGAFSRLAQHSRSRSVIAALLFTSFLCALALSVSPELHAAVHPHAGQAEHTCVVTLIGSGQYEHSAPAPICLASELLISSPVPVRSAPAAVSPFLEGSVFEHAPPFCS